MKALDHAAVRLSGMNLIEASAGTGKTYAITSLYLRLLVEKGLRPEQILAVTYTDAATKELRAKIRLRIREALHVLDGGDTDDAFLLLFLKKAQAPGIANVKEILERALGDFDTASIYTIHGFCLRALEDNVFESGSLYDTELIKDQTALVQEILDDFWRIHFFSEPAPLLSYALQHKAPEVFRLLLKGLHAGSGVKVIPEFSPDEVAAIEASCHFAGKKIAEMWQTSKDSIVELMRNDKGLSRSEKNYRLDLIEPLFGGMDAFVEHGNTFDLFVGFEKFACSGIIGGTKPSGSPPVHPFFDWCEALFSGVEQLFLALQAELVSFYRTNLPLRKRTGNVRFFNDLLDDLYGALFSESGGEILADLLRKKYCAALIDEFQDTDPVQYEIFRRIYAGCDAPLFLIGDPKQAIYSFRGADIYAYLTAAREIEPEKRFTLTDNWRSTPRLLRAFNLLFEQQKNPFMYDGIRYHSLKAGNVKALELLEQRDTAPFQLWFMNAGETKSGGLTVEDASRFASLAVACEICRLLTDAKIVTKHGDERQVKAEDIAVIVRTHRQAGTVMRALKAKGIPGVMQGDMSIFASAEARDVSILLSALCDPANETKVRSALVTDILGRSGNDIADLMDDEDAYATCLKDFQHYHHQWVERGFMVMIRELMAAEGVRGRLLSSTDIAGERRLTNLLHCFELLHSEEHLRGLGMEGLAAWFDERIGADDEAEEYQIRLETDESAVKIVTVHVSKGLEYPIVFCPFLWNKVNSNGNTVMFHDENSELVKDFGSTEFAQHKQVAEKESLAESLRLLYVALTRAKNRCYLITGKTKADISPINYLFHASRGARTDDNQASTLFLEAKGFTEESMKRELQGIADGSEGSIEFTQLSREGMDTTEASFELSTGQPGWSPQLRMFTGSVDSSWRVSSFTSFSRNEQKHAPHHAELPDRDDATGASKSPVAVPGEKSIFSFPRGAQAGIFMHWIFEKLDFAAPQDDAIHELVTKGLERYSYEPEWLPHISNMVRHVLLTSLTQGEKTFCLGSLGRGRWITELEFFIPLRFVTSALFGEVLERHGIMPGGVDLGAYSEILQFKPVKGMLMGFIDMVFEAGGQYYLLDWKSNHLGNSTKDYGHDAMKQAMDNNLYFLQYLLYTVALNRYLSLRVENYAYSTHFGGVMYVFMRGVSEAEGETTGFYRAHPSEALVQELSQLLIETEG